MSKCLCSHALPLVLAGAVAFTIGCAEKSAVRANSATNSANRVAATPDDNRPASGRGEERIAREVRHELVMLPYYGVFDNLSYSVSGSTVTLSGQVTRPTLKSDAGNVVKDIEGVERVVNNIEVLPTSPNDDRTRMAVYRAIYGQAALNRYGLQAVPPIHIIVKNGNVTLEGVVANEGDKNIANVQANGVSGVFSVTNNLRVEK
jgi:hyperosmotically inducible protein